MPTKSHISFKRYLNVYPLLSLTVSALLLTALSMNSQKVWANPFLPSSTPASSIGSCPATHKMYYIGATPPTYSPINTQNLSWTAGNTSKNFTFTENSGDKVFKINFSQLLDLNSNYGGTPPFYGSINGATTAALNLVHNSPAVKTNHVLDISVNRPVSKIGYKIQDLDSTGSSGQIPYVEEVDVSASKGQLTANATFHSINTAKDIVTAREGQNCSNAECTIEATWNYNLTDVLLNLKHKNTLSQRNSVHAIGYSDFYFCLAPPKVIVKKQLNGNRVNDSNQFSISINSPTTTLKTFETSGSGQAVTNDNSGVVNLAENTTYTITERVINGDIKNYDASYNCKNNTTGSTTRMPSGTTTYNAAAGTRSFTLTNASYGDEIICIITNSTNYVFSGTVFNDNGGITASPSTRLDISDTFTNNNSYFNGTRENNEIEITNSSLQIRLTDCNGNNIGNTTAQTLSTTGGYNFTVPRNSLAAGDPICVIETEPNDWIYSVDTTSNERRFNIASGTFVYANLDFGEVEADNTALVLKKYQYVHTCNNNLNYATINQDSDNPNLGFSMNPANNIEPGKCIAYKIDAHNRGHVLLSEVQITDLLQLRPIKSTFHLPLPKGTPSQLFDNNNSVRLDSNGKIISSGSVNSNLFNLTKAVGKATTAILYFNTKYGTTANE